MSFKDFIYRILPFLRPDYPEAKDADGHGQQRGRYGCALNVEGRASGVLIHPRIGLTVAHTTAGRGGARVYQQTSSAGAETLEHPNFRDSEDDPKHRYDHDITVLWLHSPIERDHYPKLDYSLPKGRFEVEVVGRALAYETEAEHDEDRDQLRIYAWGEDGWSGSAVYHDGKVIAIVTSSSPTKPHVYAATLDKSARWLRATIDSLKEQS
jgi:hypothetical protein